VIGRIFALFKARNLEFVRDRASMAWAVFMPFGLVLGMGFVFSGDDTGQFTVGVLGDDSSYTAERHPFFGTRFVDFVAAPDPGLALAKVGRHELDMLIETGPTTRYWINPDSPSGYVIERLLLQSDPTATREEVSGDAIRYVDWVVPGILGMNMMFSSLFGVGYVVVRYRKNGFLKRLQATPLSAFEFITAQALSRLLLTIVVQGGVFLSVLALLDITMNGSYLALLTLALLGCSAMISLALILAARVSSEELAGGLVNLIAFPMVLLSGVFYSLEGSPEILRQIAQILPLTQMLDGARAVMIDGAGMTDVLPQLGFLAVSTILFLGVASALFRWRFV
jgi:ABC-2 type transport system permease protein